MKSKSRRIALYIGMPLTIFIIFALSAGLFYLHKQSEEIDKFTPVDSQEIVGGIYAIRDDYVDFYIIQTGNSLIAIDSGQNQSVILSEMNKLKLDPSKVIAVFLTHTDIDHAGGVGLFAKAKVYISNEEEQMINGKTPRYFSLLKNSLPAGYNLLADKEDIEVAGIQVHCILTPGHTPGSMSYIVNDKYLFTGDTLSLQNGEVKVFNEFFNMGTDKQKNSIIMLSKLDNIEYIFTAHYSYSDNYKRAFDRWNNN